MAYAPDFEINTQGDDLMEAIGLTGIDMQDKGEALPEASSIGDVQEQLPEGGVISLVDTAEKTICAQCAGMSPCPPG